MDLAELRDIAENGSGNSFNEFNIDNVSNLNPNLKNLFSCNFVPTSGGLIAKIITKLTDKTFLQVKLKDLDFKRYKIHEKEDYNQLKRWKVDIKQYAPYKKRVEAIYESFEGMGTNKREVVYQWLHREYARLHDDLDADKLFDALKDKVSEMVRSDVDLFDNVSFEEMENHVCIVLVDAFIECQIFEKPV